MNGHLPTAAGALAGFLATAYLLLRRAHLFAEVKRDRS